MSDYSNPELLEASLDSIEDVFYVFSPDGSFVEWNETLTSVTGYTDEEISNLNPIDLVADAERKDMNEALNAVTRDSTVVTFATVLETKTGNHIPYEFQWAPFGVEEETNGAVAALGREITDRYQLFEEQQSMTAGSQKLSVPIVEIWDGILLSTVIGKLSSAEAETFTENLLSLIADRNASVAIIDITGAESVDTQTAQHLIDTIHAVKLMGGQTIITGLNPDISQTLVKLGIGFDVETQASLQDGLKTALEIQGVSIN